MANTRFKGETAGERLDYSGISDSDMIQLRHKPGTINDSDKGISKANLLSCPFGVSDTAAGTVAKTASLTDSNPDFSLVSGREVVVCFTTANSASTPTLNFAGSGAYPLYYPDGSAVGAWAAGTWMHLKYFSATVGGNAIQRWILLSPLPVDTVALNNMQSVTSNAVANALGGKLNKEYWTLFSDFAPASEQVKNTYINRKFSDYEILIFVIGADNVNTRNTIIVPREVFANANESIYIFAHGSGQIVEVDIKYNDDTSIKIHQDVTTGNPFTPYIRIYGI